MTFDIPTLLLMNVYLSVVACFALTVLLRRSMHCPGLSWWLAALYAMTGGLISFYFRTELPEGIAVVLCNILPLTGFAAIWLGGRKYARVGTRSDIGILVIGPVVALINYILVCLQFAFAWRIFVFSLAGFLLSLMCALVLRDNLRQGEWARRVWSGLFLVNAVLVFIRLSFILFFGWPEDLEILALPNAATIVVAGTVVLCSAYCLMMVSFEWLQTCLQQLADRDSLTGLYNRRALQQMGHARIQESLRKGTALTVAMVDIDHFKTINDDFGHQAGDAALQAIASCLQSHCRSYDLLARYGGEEFIVILPDTRLEDMFFWAERVRNSIESLSAQGTRHGKPFTVSLGVAEMSAEDTLDTLIRRADAAMYEAKHAGRNQVFCAPLEFGILS